LPPASSVTGSSSSSSPGVTEGKGTSAMRRTYALPF
jgi:hypothetical protein